MIWIILPPLGCGLAKTGSLGAACDGSSHKDSKGRFAAALASKSKCQGAVIAMVAAAVGEGGAKIRASPCRPAAKVRRWIQVDSERAAGPAEPLRTFERRSPACWAEVPTWRPVREAEAKSAQMYDDERCGLGLDCVQPSAQIQTGTRRLLRRSLWSQWWSTVGVEATEGVGNDGRRLGLAVKLQPSSHAHACNTRRLRLRPSVAAPAWR